MNAYLSSARDIREKLVAMRRYLHENPEIRFDLPKTTAFVMQRLREMGLDPREISKSAVVATIGKGGKTLLLRGRHGCLAHAGDH